MTVETNINRNDYQVDGVALGPFAYEFRILQESDLQVYENGVLTAKAYTVAGVGDVQGGSVTFTSQAPALGQLSLIRIVDENQSTDYRPYDAFPAERMEADLDKLTMRDQQLQEASERSIQFPPDNVGLTQFLPAIPNRANKLLSFDNAGQILMVEGTDQSATFVTPADRTTSRSLAVQATLAQGVADITDPQFGASTSKTGAQNSAAIQAIVDANYKAIYVPEGSFPLATAGTFTGYQGQTFNYAVLVQDKTGVVVFGPGTFTVDASVESPAIPFAFVNCQRCRAEGFTTEGQGTHPANFTPLGAGASVYFHNGIGNRAVDIQTTRMGDGAVLSEETYSRIEGGISNIIRGDETKHHGIIYGGAYCIIDGLGGYGSATDGNIGAFGTGLNNVIRNCETTKSQIDDDSYAGTSTAQMIFIDSGQIGCDVDGNTCRGGFYGISVKTSTDATSVRNNRVTGAFIGIAFWQGEGAQVTSGGSITGNTVLMNGANDDQSKPSGWSAAIQQGVGIYIAETLNSIDISAGNYIGDDYQYTMGIIGDGAQTAFTFKHDVLNVASITKNGTALSDPADYSVSGSTITFTVAPTSTDKIKITVGSCRLNWCGVHIRATTNGTAFDQNLMASISGNTIELNKNFTGVVQRSYGHAVWALVVSGSDLAFSVSVSDNKMKDGLNAANYEFGQSLVYIQNFSHANITENDFFTNMTGGSVCRLRDCYHMTFNDNSFGDTPPLVAERTDAASSSIVIGSNQVRPVGNGSTLFKTNNIRNVSLTGNAYSRSNQGEGYMYEVDTRTSAATNARVAESGNIWNARGKGVNAYYAVNGVDNATSAGSVIVERAANAVFASSN